jgi:hypothetical protein
VKKNRVLRIVFAIVILFVVSSCSREKKAKENDFSSHSPADAGKDRPEGSSMRDSFDQNGDSITIPEFEIEIALTEGARKKLKDARESIIVQAYITGSPKKGVAGELTEMGELNLADPKVELTNSGVARFEGVNIARSNYEDLADEDFHILINVFSGRRSTQLNLLDCDILEEPISVVRAKRHTLTCKLIGN